MRKLREQKFTQFRRKQIAELRPYVPGEGMEGVSISQADMLAGSPKHGDMIARNPKNHEDVWLVAAQYFADNFEPLAALSAPKAEAVEPVDYQRREGRSTRHAPDEWDWSPWHAGRLPAHVENRQYRRYEERALYTSPVPALTDEALERTLENAARHARAMIDHYVNGDEGFGALEDSYCRLSEALRALEVSRRAAFQSKGDE